MPYHVLFLKRLNFSKIVAVCGILELLLLAWWPWIRLLTVLHRAGKVCDGKYFTDNLWAIIFHDMEHHKDGNFANRDRSFGCWFDCWLSHTVSVRSLNRRKSNIPFIVSLVGKLDTRQLNKYLLISFSLSITNSIWHCTVSWIGHTFWKKNSKNLACRFNLIILHF